MKLQIGMYFLSPVRVSSSIALASFVAALIRKLGGTFWQALDFALANSLLALAQTLQEQRMQLRKPR